MADVFISYSRKDKVFARRLFERLKQENYSSWMDWANIQGGNHWWEDIKAGIEGANNFIFIISSDSYTSGICHREIEYARQNGKRIIPVVRREVTKQELAGHWIDKEWEAVARSNFDALAELDYVFFRKKSGFDCLYDEATREVLNPECDQADSDADDFETAFSKLFEALNQDPENAQLHTRYFLRAKEWQENQREDSLLIGTEIDEAEQWLEEWERITTERLSQNPPLLPLKPEPLELHRKYIASSRDAEIRRTKRLRNIRRASIISAIVAGITLIFAIGASIVGVQATDKANVAGTQVANANATLTPVVPTLTQAANNIQFADTEVAQVQQQVVNANAELTSIPPTLTFVAALIDEQEAIAKAIELSNTARTLIDAGETNEGIAVVLNSLIEFPSNWSENTLVYGLRNHPINLALTEPQLKNTVIQITWSPNGRMVLTNSFDEMIVWDATNSKQLLSFPSSFGSAQWSSNGELILSTQDNIIHFWNVSTGQEVETALSGLANIIQTAWSPDERFIMTVDKNNVGKIWELSSGDEIVELPQPMNDFLAPSWSPDGNYLATGCPNASICIWDAKTPQFNLMQLLSGHTDSLRDVSWNPNSTEIVTASSDGTAKVWDVNTGEAISTYTYTAYILSVDWSPNGEYIVSSSWSGNSRVWIWNPYTSEDILDNLHGFSDHAYSLAWSPDGMSIAAAGMFGEAFIWQIVGGTNPIIFNHEGIVRSGAWSPHSDFVVSGGDDNIISLWDSATGDLLDTTKAELPIHSMDWSSNDEGQIVFSGGNSNNGFASILDVHNSQLTPVSSITSLPNVYASSWSPNGSYVALATENGIYLWNILDDSIEKIEDIAVAAIDWSPDSSQIVSCEMNYASTSIFNIQTEQSYELPFDGCLDVSWSSVSERIAITIWNEVYIWDTSTQSIVQILSGHNGQVNSVDWSPNDSSLVTSSRDTTIKVWNSETGLERYSIDAHTNVVWDAVWSPDGEYILSVSWDGTAKVWRAWETTQDLIDYTYTYVYLSEES